jgi:tRNA U34 5-methylaminomethyl-2-thiouridine-forming methyltransferase MnmC
METSINERAEIVQTSDGSCTLYLKDMDETYHSRHGAHAESLHVYIRNGLDRLAEKKRLNILEVGFGTGLNALLTLDHVPAGQHVSYCSIEPYPLSAALTHAYYDLFDHQPSSLPFIDRMLLSDGQEIALTESFTFQLIEKKLEMLEAGDMGGRRFDLVYYDAFGPSKQADMWTLDMLSRVTGLMAEDGLLVTYCAQGQFKRHLKSMGLRIENPPGPWGKREMTVAVR